eukprot:CAMPEP_0116999352 /NCGR_PEP_ID=MMETSP0472-20121206/2087_1 /TAXON_ID=693140 ORGANISM="Tiarina fusus, Strain LIS" /NCGR_SAMPLE_ID=MMETSP0472 /ASSEMBLY_ACC=CAM_ASM_000603 /LENGTH=270 /DNA_ID=CAMNT_0004698745 /DNA_START=61 /DNA_END=872 /DNA_ORIENTATION=+
MSIPSQAALAHLRSIKPNDGWAVQKDDKGLLKLLRRNVPLSDNSFLDIHYDSPKNIVVGVMTKDGQTCQLLVDEGGKPVAGIRVVSVSTYVPGTARNVNFTTARSNVAPPRRNTPRSAPAAATETAAALPLSPEQNKEVLKYAVDLRSDKLLYTFGIILLYLYMLQTCPSMRSFDAKKELKRVLRGHHLPEDHPDKPKGFFEDLAARVAASVTAELATFPGYEMTMTPFGGAAILVEVRVPTAKTTCYWVGAFGKWHYVHSREIPDTHYD